ncbi:hypothetical protein BD309DRAFT_210726 [Dichomitus squalens]|nr:hypothetical protein BD309DRAFT_210726 [Dichomitus squalens]
MFPLYSICVPKLESGRTSGVLVLAATERSTDIDAHRRYEIASLGEVARPHGPDTKAMIMLVIWGLSCHALVLRAGILPNRQAGRAPNLGGDGFWRAALRAPGFPDAVGLSAARYFSMLEVPSIAKVGIASEHEPRQSPRTCSQVAGFPRWSWYSNEYDCEVDGCQRQGHKSIGGRRVRQATVPDLAGIRFIIFCPLLCFAPECAPSMTSNAPKSHVCVQYSGALAARLRHSDFVTRLLPVRSTVRVASPLQLPWDYGF